MGTPADGFVRLLEAPDPVEAELARELLESSGIPSMLHGQDRDFAELGQAIHLRISRPDVYVPEADLERARALLAEAWNASSLTDTLAEAQPLEEPVLAPPSTLARRVFEYGFLAALAAALLIAWMRSSARG